MKINNNVILITGGSAGIGEALVNSLLKKENQIIICSRHKSKSIEDLEQLYKLRHLPCDLRRKSDIINVFELLEKENIRLNILINNAGIIDDSSILKQEINYNDLHDIISVNLLAPIILTHLFLKQLPNESGAGIINIGSKTAFTPDSSFLTYSASKAGLHSLSICLREQLKASGIKIFEIIPPRVDTAMSRKVAKNKNHFESPEMMTPEDCAEKIIQAVQSDIYEFKMPHYNNYEY